MGHIEKQTLENADVRRVLFSGEHTQLVLMCLKPGEEIGDEVHQDVDQFFRIEHGEGTVHKTKVEAEAAEALAHG